MSLSEIQTVNIDRIQVNPTKVEASETATFDVEDVHQLPPIKVEPHGQNFYIVNGHHRYRTALKQGKTTMRVVVVNPDDD
ncbi:ParB/RepB/Spo0J family partition protein [Leptothoe spongobia]|uniref:ParB-like nuclease domain-containing protein n=1 Tax=Leptothoe spongobia TAU-MAC 1115 TaxID=1967444 RepID=A0A947GKR7_9CYAN|nr:ParB/RepB/Spo0J family partition protein [Leptothoe spongobia]MBT9314471.1 ParB-like nuclease domain-containing protein [Leptothoe spongobia TAU-MAC 1115]